MSDLSAKVIVVFTQPQSRHTFLELTDEPAPDLRERRLDVVEVGRGRHEVRHLEDDRPFTCEVHNKFLDIFIPSPYYVSF